MKLETGHNKENILPILNLNKDKFNSDAEQRKTRSGNRSLKPMSSKGNEENNYSEKQQTLAEKR